MRFVAPISLRSRTRLLSALGAVLAFVFFAGPVLADDQPFDPGIQQLDVVRPRYKDKPANWLTPDPTHTAVAAQPVVIAPPTLLLAPILAGHERSDPSRYRAGDAGPQQEFRYPRRFDRRRSCLCRLFRPMKKRISKSACLATNGKMRSKPPVPARRSKAIIGSGSFNACVTRPCRPG